MGTKNETVQLNEPEVKVLETLLTLGKASAEQLGRKIGVDTGAITATCERLAQKGLVKIMREEKTGFILTEDGEKYCEIGAPEDRLVEFLKQNGPQKLDELAEKVGLSKQEFSGAFGQLMKTRVLSVKKTEEGKIVQLTDVPFTPTKEFLLKIKENKKLSKEEEKLAKQLVKRGMIQTVTSVTLWYEIPDKQKVKELIEEWKQKGPEVTNLTPKMIRTGSWRNVRFKRYDLSIPPPFPSRWGMRHGYYAFLDYIRQKFIALGFKEMEGGLVIPEFWNMDALYMPQFHPARAIHDAYYADLPIDQELEEEFIDAVAKVHETGEGADSRGWGYKFDRNVTRRLVLRSQGTALSSWTLAHNPEIPGRYFAIAKCFRYDKIDATHLPDFYQVEGIVLDENNSFGTLLSLLKLFAKEFAGTEKIKLAPAYFPFTEPSVELHAQIPGVGWIELGGAGIFRPEVTKPFGIDVPVIAWGLGLDRIGMFALGIKDIRHLLSRDFEELRDLNRRMTNAKIRGKLR